MIDNDLKMGKMGGGNCYINNHLLYQQDCDSNNGDMSSGYGFETSHTLSQFIYYSTFKNIYNDFEKGDGDVISGYGFFKQPHYIPT